MTKIITKLPSMEHTFTISVKGSETNQLFEGTFTYQRLTLGRRLDVSKMEARLREEIISLPTDVNIYTEMVAFLRYGLIKFPDWWKESNYGLNLFDINVITTLYQETQNFEKEWEKQIYSNNEEKAK